MRIVRVVIAAAVFVAAASAQTQQKYAMFKETALSASAEVITMQQPASGAKNVQFDAISVWCSAECTFTIERDGTAGTVGSQLGFNINDGTSPTVNAFASSDVGAGSKILIKHTVSANTSQSFDMKDVRFFGSGTSKNVSVRFASMTGTVRVYAKWGEQ